jgi:hypothetical protein
MGFFLLLSIKRKVGALEENGGVLKYVDIYLLWQFPELRLHQGASLALTWVG